MKCFTVVSSAYVSYLFLLLLCSKVLLACENTPIKQWRKTDHPFPLISWSEVRGHMRELIRGKKAPASLSIVLQLRPDMMEQMLTAEGYPQLRDNIGAMVLNIRYDGKEVTLVTGIALKSFTLDRNADRIWDEAMGRFLASCEIGYALTRGGKRGRVKPFCGNICRYKQYVTLYERYD